MKFETVQRRREGATGELTKGSLFDSLAHRGTEFCQDK